MRNLFKPPSEALTGDLALALKAIHAATPLSRAHAHELIFAVRDLSAMLTRDRAGMARSYWINKRLLTAYCRYFLPWNLVRLSWLLPGLDLPAAAGDRILDLGSGPLTMPIALWLAKPEWRNIPLTFTCADVAPGPLALGREIFTLLAPESPWTFELRRGPLEAALRACAGRAALVTAANVLNECKPARDMPLDLSLAALGARIAAALTPGGRFLAVEPGTRLGGKLVATLRHAAFSAHLLPESPCPHWGACPMLARESTGWCHFAHTTEPAPKPLADLTAKAGLHKHSLSLSCLLLRAATEEERRAAAALLPEEAPDPFDDDTFDDRDDYNDDAMADKDALAAMADAYAALRAATPERPFARILSDPIRLPDKAEPARYGCSVKGLVLAHGALRVPSGAAIAVRWPAPETRDIKTGAINIAAVLSAKDAPAPDQHRAAPDPAQQKRRPPRPQNPAPSDGRTRPARPAPGKQREQGPGANGTPARPANPDRPARPARPANPDRPGRPDKAGKPARSGRPNRPSGSGRAGGKRRQGDT